MPDKEIAPTYRERAIHLGSYGCGILAISMGMALTFQGDARLLAPAWKVALKLPIDQRFWGIYLAVCGVVILTALARKADSRFIVAACFAIAFAYWARCMAGLFSIFEPTGSWIGPQMWGAFSVAYLTQGIIHLRRFKS